MHTCIDGDQDCSRCERINSLPTSCDCGRAYGVTLMFGHDVRCALRVEHFGGPHD